MFKKFLSVLLITVLVTSTFVFAIPATTASAETDGYYTYTVSNGKATITDVNTSISGNVTIPSTLGGYPVTSIGYSAFQYCTGLTSVTIGNGVTSIGYEAFYGCTGLKEITIPDSVTSIGSYAFYDCTSLESVKIPDSVKDIGGSAFQYCTGLTSVTIGNGVTSIGYDAFYGCAGLTSVTIPDSVTSIGQTTFRYCTGLTSVTIGNGVTSIGSSAFSDCTGLKEITIPENVTSIGSYAFYDCTSLESVKIPDSVKDIGYFAFYGCTGLMTVNFNAINCTRMGDGSSPVFSGCTNLATVNIGKNVTKIPSYAFKYCTALTSVTIPDSVTSIGQWAFSDCTDLTTVNYNAINCTNVGNSSYPAFNGCTNLTTVNIGENVTIIPDYAFYNCKGLTSITIPDSVTSIGRSAFYNCKGLTSITIPESVTSIGSSAFSGCTGLTSIIMPDSVTIIPDYAFYNCKGLTSITIPESVTSIGSSAFSDCTGLTSVTIGNGVTSIGNRAFYNCKGLTSITIPESVTSIGYYAFGGCYNLWHILYAGDEETWNNISIGSSGNSYITNATKHFNSDGTEITFGRIEATCTEQGYDSYKCSICESTNNGNYQEALGHSNEVISVVEPTCSNEGYTKYRCSVCGHESNSDYIDALGHAFVNGSCTICRMLEEDCIESEHNYANNCDETWTITKENAKRIAITFSKDTYTEDGWDFIYIYDGEDNLVGKYSGNELSSKRIAVYSSVVKIRLTSDSSVTKYGFVIIDIKVFYDDCLHPTTIVNELSATCTEDGYTGDVYCAECDVVITFGSSIPALGHKYENGYCTVCGKIEGLIYSIDDNEIVITGYEGNPTELNIPSLIDGYTVTKIASFAFGECTSLTKIVLPNTITDIGDSAFEECTGLTSVTIGNGVTSIGNRAFYNCTGLKEITIPENVTSIGSQAFLSCTSLETLNYFAKNCKTSYHLNSYSYYGPRWTELKTVNFGSNVESIGDDMFYGCSLIENITIPNSVNIIGDSAFFECTGLKEITIPDSVTSIGSYAFYDCTSLESVKIPDSVKTIGGSAFEECTGLKNVTIGEGVQDIGGSAFEGCTGLVSVTIGDGVTRIGSYAFYNCTGLTSVTIGNAVTSIGEWAFYDCDNINTVIYNGSKVGWKLIDISSGNYYLTGATIVYLVRAGLEYSYDSDLMIATVTGLDSEDTNIVIPSTVIYKEQEYRVTRIGSYAFYNCTGLTSITIPDSVTSIGDNAFRGCTGLTTVDFNAVNCITMGSYYDMVFGDCINLKTVNIGDKVTQIPDYAFKDCTGLTSVTIGNSVTSIGDYAFSGCTGLTSVTISNSVTSIGKYAFYYCTGLTSIIMPDSVTIIPDYAFYNCKGLTSITIPESVTSIGDNAFRGCTGLTSVTIGNSVTSIGSYAFYNCGRLSDVFISLCVTKIDRYAFSYCDNLWHILYAGDEEAWNNISIDSSGNSYITNATKHFNADGIEISFERIEPTCTEQGYDIYKCSICDSTKSRNYQPLGHNFVNGSCSNCGMFEEDCIESEHNYANNCDETWTITKENAKRIAITFSKDTYTEDGWDFIYIYDGNDNLIGKYSGNELSSKRIGVYSSVVKIRLTSDYSNTYYGFSLTNVEAYYEDCLHSTTTIVNELSATCTEDGYTGDVYCAECNAVITFGSSIPAVGHQETFVNTVSPTCTEDGYDIFYCSTCDSYYEKYINAFGHSNEQIGIVSPTCYEQGYTLYKCIVCEHETKGDYINGHTFEDGVCVYCNVLKDDLIESEHNYPNNCDKTWTINKVGAKQVAITFSIDTYTESGWDFIYIYDGNDNLIGEYSGDELASKQIVVDGDTVKIRLTSDESYTYYGFAIIGIKVFYDDCLHSNTKLINESTATCTDNGNTGDTYCIDCQEIIASGENIPALGHKYENGYCTVCGKIEGLIYTIDDNEIVITGYEGNPTELNIPSLIEGYTVTSIGDCAFYDCTGLTSITIPTTVTSIADNAFYGCGRLSQVYFEGTEEEWNEVTIGGGNEELKLAEIIFTGDLYKPTYNEIENNFDNVIVSNAWVNRYNKNFSGKYALHTTTGGKVQFSFTGTQFGIVSYKSPSQGKLYISIDGGEEIEVSLYDEKADTYFKETVFTSDELNLGTHTVTVRVEGKAVLDAINLKGKMVKCETPIKDIVRIETENMLDATYTGKWSKVYAWMVSAHNAMKSSNGTVTFDFEGDMLSIISYKAKTQGKLYVSIDGNDEIEVDLYDNSTDKLYQEKVFTEYLDYGNHTVTIRTSGAAIVDAIEINRNSAETVTYEAEDKQFELTGSWKAVETWSLSNHKALQGSNGASVSFSYTGYDFKIISYKAKSQGKMYISIDGAAPIEVDLYDASTDTKYKEIALDAAGLDYGTHTVTITTSGKVILDAVKIDGILN